MDYKKACDIFGFSNNLFTYKELKHTYYKLALNYHPDRNHHDEKSTERFQELYSAYEFLCNYMNIERDKNEETIKNDDDYFSIFKKFLSSEYNINIDSMDLLNECKMVSLKMFENLDKKSSLDVLNYMELYSDIVLLDDTIKNEVKSILKNKIKNDESVILKSTIENLFNGDIYKLKYNDMVFCVPLWHDEITYDLLQDKILIVKCIPELPEHIKIDDNNNIHMYINVCSSTLFQRETIPVQIYNDKVFEIPIKELNIVKTQIYTFYKMGIPTINTRNVFSTEKKGNVVVHIQIIPY